MYLEMTKLGLLYHVDKVELLLLYGRTSISRLCSSKSIVGPNPRVTGIDPDLIFIFEEHNNHKSQHKFSVA
jgi:hypothetical protein